MFFDLIREALNERRKTMGYEDNVSQPSREANEQEIREARQRQEQEADRRRREEEQRRNNK